MTAANAAHAKTQKRAVGIRAKAMRRFLQDAYLLAFWQHANARPSGSSQAGR